MSDAQSRPRGRTSTRGGRAGFGSRGGRNGRGHATNGDKAENLINAPIDDDSEVSQLKKKYGVKVHTIKEMFPEWTDEDVVFALQETDGDLEMTVERITDGQTPLHMSCFQRHPVLHKPDYNNTDMLISFQEP
jgi:CUE domain